MFFLSCFLLCFHTRLFINALWSPAWKRLPLGSRLWRPIVNLSFSHWYPGSGVGLDCIIPDLCPLSYFDPFIHSLRYFAPYVHAAIAF